MKNINFLIKLKKESKLELVDSNEEIKKSYLEKSKSNFISSKILLENDRLEEAVSLIYYSAYNIILSLLFNIGIKSENHSESIILLKEIFDIENQTISLAKEERIHTQYYVDFSITREGVIELINKVEEFNEEMINFISKLTNEKINLYRNKFIKIIQL